MVAATDKREDIAAFRIDRHECGLQRRLPCSSQPGLDRAFCRVLQLRDKRRIDAPVGRMIAAEFIAESLTKVRLGITVAAGAVAAIWLDAHRRLACLRFLRGSNETLVAHPRQHDVTAPLRLVEVVPRRQRRRRPRETGNQRALGETEILRRLATDALRHRFHAVNAGAEENAIQVELEDLLLAQLTFDQECDHGFASLAPITATVGQEQRARQLLRQRAATLVHSGRDVADQRAAERDRIDAGVKEEAVIFNRKKAC